ncbi:MAG: LysM peptidoglycan-binding domain-containing protein, partial [Phycisphaerales bacterium]|nr:LysM peptidoglycan-binding domain-containing protein [Phycisphaerales bacterium]
AGPVPNTGATVGRPPAERRVPTRETQPAEPAPATTTYVVREGDTLSDIARVRLGSEQRWEAIARLNPGLDPARLQIGQQLILPASAAVADRATTPVAGRAYVVAAGDSLSSIARSVYGTTAAWDRIYDANRGVIGSDPHALEVGMRLVLPAR